MKKLLLILIVFVCYKGCCQKEIKLKEQFNQASDIEFKEDKYDSISLNKNCLFSNSSILVKKGTTIRSLFNKCVLKKIIYANNIGNFKYETSFYVIKKDSFYYMTCYFERINLEPKEEMNSKYASRWINGLFIYKEQNDFLYFFRLNESKIESTEFYYDIDTNNNLAKHGEASFKLNSKINASDVISIFELDLGLNSLRRINFYKGKPISYSKIINNYCEDMKLLAPDCFESNYDLFNLTWGKLTYVELHTNCESIIMRLKTKNEENERDDLPLWLIDTKYSW